VKALVGYFFGALVAAGPGLMGCGDKREHVGNRSEGSGGSGGSAGTAGTGGDAGPDPDPQQRSSKLDLLLVIDNSRSMADKQAILGRSAASLVSRLINPPCVDMTGTAVEFPPADQACSAGQREMAPVRDMHIGVISSSLGGHGADQCSPALTTFDPSENDRGELLVRAGETYQGSGYLLWDPDQKASPPGENDWSLLASKVGTLVTGAGELGCGFESQLEAWYRFLIDPEPPAEVVVRDGVAVIEGVNQTILDQRARFLRPDSAVLVVMLTDENDCSIQDGGTAWMAGQGSAPDSGIYHLGRATADCAVDPNSPCCRSCTLVESQPPSGCAPLSEEAACRPPLHTDPSDGYNLRCFDQKRRFGVDFLHPISRYVRGLTSPTVPDRSGAMVQTPLFADLATRDHSLISVAAIAGVPWQDLARNPGDAVNLRYMTSRELRANDRWTTILGDPARGEPPADPFMRESIGPRSGENPVTGDIIQPPSATSASASAINGHEWDPPERNDLQYACIFPLTTPRECGDTSGCDCSSIDGRGNKVLCQGPDGAYGTRQYFAKAYPGLRHLELLSQLGDSAVVASICPRNITDASREDYAYRPAVQAIVDRMTKVMKNSDE
jgi:hypothetical protein